MTSSSSNRPCTGATYTVTATTSGYGSLSNIATLPRQLVHMHMSLYPETPRQDVMALHCGYGNDHVVLARGNDPRLLKVDISLRHGAWTPTQKRALIERTHAQLIEWKGKKASQTDLIVQVTEIDDWNCVLRNGRWGMWAGAVPTDAAARTTGEGVSAVDDDGTSIAESERTLVG